MLKAKVRGIYATALTKLLLDNGFSIVDPSLPIQERFGLCENRDFPDLKIEDRYDRQGVRVVGCREAVDRFKEIIWLNLEDVITRRPPINLKGIYKGRVKGEINGFLLVDIGETVGKLPKNEVDCKENNHVLVQVKRRSIVAGNPLLTTKIKFAGKFAVLIKAEKIGVSLRIRDVDKRFELYRLGKRLAPSGWGIIWRSEAENQSNETLENEIKELTWKAEKVMDKFKKVESPSLILDGLHLMDVEFPALSKKRLDEIRSEVTATLKGHHYYKVCGGKVSSMLEMVERLLEKGASLEEVGRLFKETVEDEYPSEGSPIKIEHVKPSGIIFNLGQGIIEEIERNGYVRYRRVFHKPGFYDGLGVRKESGDIAVTELKVGDWTLKTSYYSHNGEYKGTYINLNTPIELYPHGIRYVDLEVDVCVCPDGSAKILDEEKLWRAVEKGYIKRSLAESVMDKAEKIFEEFREK